MWVMIRPRTCKEFARLTMRDGVPRHGDGAILRAPPQADPTVPQARVFPSSCRSPLCSGCEVRSPAPFARLFDEGGAELAERESGPHGWK